MLLYFIFFVFVFVFVFCYSQSVLPGTAKDQIERNVKVLHHLTATTFFSYGISICEIDDSP